MAIDQFELIKIIGHIRRCFQLLKTASDASLADFGLTASLRAVLEHLDAHGPQTVPQIGAAKSVARQSIQAIVDDLGHRGLVTLGDNPAHRRSPLIALSHEGEAVFAEIRKRDRVALRALAKEFGVGDLAGATRTLATLERALWTMKGESVHEPS